MTARQRGEAARRAITGEDRRQRERAILAAVLDWPSFAAADTVMAYASIGTEVDTYPLLGEILARGKRLFLPRTMGRGIMTAMQVSDLGACVPGAYGILEPPEDAYAADPTEIDLILVPGLAFDRHGNRVGHGAGYYDRYLAAYGGLTCGVCFAAQVVQGLSPQPHDVPVGALATEAGVHIILKL